MPLTAKEKKEIRERADKFLAENVNNWSWFGYDEDLTAEEKKEK